MKTIVAAVALLALLATGGRAQVAYYSVSNPGIGACTMIGSPTLGWGRVDQTLPLAALPAGTIYVLEDIPDLTDAAGGSNFIWDSSLPSVQVDVNGNSAVTVAGAVRGMNAAELARAAGIQAAQANALSVNIASIRVLRQTIIKSSQVTTAQQAQIDRIMADYVLAQNNIQDFLFTLTTASQSIARGANKNNTVTCSQINSMADMVALSTDATLPAGVTVAFGTNPIANCSGSSAFNVAVAAGAVPGIYQINLIATTSPFSGQATNTVVYTLTIT